MDSWPASRCAEEMIIRKVITLETWPDIDRSTRMDVVLTCLDPELTGQAVTTGLRRALEHDSRLRALYRSVERDENNLGGISMPLGPPRGLLRWICKEPRCVESLIGDREGPYGPIRCKAHNSLLVLAL